MRDDACLALKVFEVFCVKSRSQVCHTGVLNDAYPEIPQAGSGSAKGDFTLNTLTVRVKAVHPETYSHTVNGILQGEMTETFEAEVIDCACS